MSARDELLRWILGTRQGMKYETNVRSMLDAAIAEATERLQAEIEQLRGTLPSYSTEQVERLRAERDQLHAQGGDYRAEIERLRASALRRDRRPPAATRSTVNSSGSQAGTSTTTPPRRQRANHDP